MHKQVKIILYLCIFFEKCKVSTKETEKIYYSEVCPCLCLLMAVYPQWIRLQHECECLRLMNDLLSIYSDIPPNTQSIIL